MVAIYQNDSALIYASKEFQEEIKTYSYGVPELLKYYENLPISMVTLDGNKYILPNKYILQNIHNSSSKDKFKPLLREHGGIGPGDFNIFDIETSTVITSISQLREYIFKFEIHEEPKFFLVWTPEDE